MADSLSVLSFPIQPVHLPGSVGGIQAKTNPGQSPVSGEGSRELRKACSELESLFIYQLFKEMRATIPKTGFLSGGKGEDLYTSMLDAQVAKELAASRGIGLSAVFVDRLEDKTGTGDKKDGEK
ncbi:MAG: rod-binding protein [Desulfatiglandaceae bacterium]